MRTLITAAATLGSALAFTPVVDAADNGIYLGASVGQGGVKVDDLGSAGEDFDANATAYKVIAGWRFLNSLAAEANYVDLGSSDDTVADTKIESDVTGLTLSLVGFLPVGPVDLFARIGVIAWDAKVKVPEFSVSSKEDGQDFTYGVGAGFRIGSAGLRAEYERFEVSDADRVDMISVGLTWTFL